MTLLYKSQNHKKSSKFYVAGIENLTSYNVYLTNKWSC